MSFAELDKVNDFFTTEFTEHTERAKIIEKSPDVKTVVKLLIKDLKPTWSLNHA
jgi:hypothetical protein